MGYFGYEAINNYTNSSGKIFFPNIAVGLYDWAIIVDHKECQSWIVFDKKNSFIEHLSRKFNLKI